MSQASGSTATFKSTLDEQDIFYRSWKVTSPAVAVYIVHGLSEHSGRYTQFASMLSTTLNANVFAIDHRAHGYTSCPKGAEDVSQLGVFNTTKDKRTLNCLQAMGSDLLQLVEETSVGQPIILFGHSMGSVIARCCLRLAPTAVHDRVKGVVLSGIPTVPSVLERFPLLVLVSAAIALGRGQDTLHRFIMGKFDSAVRRSTGNKNLPKNCFLTSVLEEVEKYRNDPLCDQTVDLHLWKSMRSSLIELELPQEFFKSLGDKRMPILFISGKNDPVCAYGKTSERCAKGMKDMGFPVKEVFLDNCLHEFLYETPTVRRRGIEATTNWIKSKL
jgi:alpha-beta hydrolase superfamily lysophospholipase